MLRELQQHIRGPATRNLDLELSFDPLTRGDGSSAKLIHLGADRFIPLVLHEATQSRSGEHGKPVVDDRPHMQIGAGAGRDRRGEGERGPRLGIAVVAHGDPTEI